MAAKTFWKWYDKELPSGDDASNFQAAWDAAIESVEENGNSLQQLKAEIAAIAETVHIMAHNQVCDKASLVFVRDKLRQLSAV